VLDKVRLLLTVITIAINVLPIAGVLLIYRDNLLGLVVPPEINNVINDVVTPGGSLEESVGNFTFVGSQYDEASRTVTLTFEVTNPLNVDLSVNSMSADVRCAEHDFPIGHALISDPVDIGAGETASIAIEGSWTQEAIDHFLTAHEGAQTIDIELSGLSVNVNGVSIQTDEVVTIPDFPVT
jgi:hypothetical protein